MINKDFRLSGASISKQFSYSRFIFKNVDFEIRNNTALSLTGPNGSGKSTLLKIIAGVLQPTSGKVDFEIDGSAKKMDILYRHIGLVSPYLVLYEEFSPDEHFKISADLKGIPPDRDITDYYLKQFKLYPKKDDHIKTFSSGMKQRVKFILSIMSKPDILFLDEPFTNLDTEGIAIVHDIMKDQLDNGGALVVASNDERETSLCNETIDLSGYNKRKN